MFQITIQKNGYDTTYNIYDAKELLIMPQISSAAILSLPSYYSCIGTNPLTLQNNTPVVVNLDAITEFIYQSDYTEVIPFGYELSARDYNDFKRIAIHAYQNYEDEQKIEAERDLSQVKLAPNRCRPQFSDYDQPYFPAYNQQQSQTYEPQYYAQQQLPAYTQQQFQSYNQPQLPAYNQQQHQYYSQPQLPAYGQQNYQQPQRYVKTY